MEQGLLLGQASWSATAINKQARGRTDLRRTTGSGAEIEAVDAEPGLLSPVRVERTAWRWVSEEETTANERHASSPW